jgi:hypothetical protein
MLHPDKKVVPQYTLLAVLFPIKSNEENAMGTALNWDALREDAVATMSRYVQFDTTNPPGNEMPAAEWLADQLRNRGITRDVIIHEPVPRSTGLNLIRNRKGHTPHIAAMTAEPLPTRLASLALGTGDLDCVLSFRPA